MPELPEVETIRLGLQRYLVGHRIEKVDVRLPKLVEGDVKNIEGSKVIAVRRFGKGLVIDLDNDYSIAIHIKLTGQLIYRGPNLKEKVKLSKKVGGNVPNKWTHVIFKLKTQPVRQAQGKKSKVKSASQNSKVKKGSEAYLYYNDLRQFGWIKIVESSRLKDLSFFRDLGPEPFKDLTLEIFQKIVSSSNVPVKPFIMDQKKIGGIGNIYANDALFDAGIDPKKKAKSLLEDEIKKLYDSILKVLKLGLKTGGATELNFVNVLGGEGGYQKHFLVYAREGKKCKRCGRIIRKIFLGGRGTYYCPSCQK